MRYKHKHKWVLEYVDAGTCDRGLLYRCVKGNCGMCKNFDMSKDSKEVHDAYLEEINRLRNL